MHAAHRALFEVGALTKPAAIGLAALLVLSSPVAALAQPEPGQPAAAPVPAAEEPGAEPPGDEPPDDEQPTFLDSVTISATLRPAPVRDTPGVVSVIDSETIQERMIEDFSDLVKYEPGVYVENNVTRLGLNGFNIRGIGGNRVMTMVDGVQTSEQFDFGPFNVHQAGLDVDVLKSVEIVRSANSALYGSDALGGVVSLFTKDPADYLLDRRFYIGAKTTWDGRADDVGVNLTLAGGSDRIQASVFTSVNRGSEIGNRGTVVTLGDTRTAPNPQDVAGQQILAKLVFNASPGNRWRATAEMNDSRVDTDWLSNNRLLDFGRFAYLIDQSAAVDTQKRQRLSLDQTLADRGLDLLSWRVYGQFNDTAQIVDEERMTSGFGPPFPSTRHGTLDYEQVGYGGSVQGQQWLGDLDNGMLITFGASYKTDYFDILRDRTETDTVTGQPVAHEFIFPTKYFPESDVVEAGVYVQGEIRLGRITLVPGVRYDHYSLDANQADPIFVASLNPEPADFADAALSPKIGMAARLTDVVTLHAQYAGGFRGAALQHRQHRLRQSPRRLYDAAESGAPGGDERQHGGRHPDRVQPRELRSQRILEPVRRLHRADGPRLQPVEPAARVPEPEPRGSTDQRNRAARRGVSDRQRDDSGQLCANRRRGDSEGRRRCSAAGRGDAARLHRAERRGHRAPVRPTVGPLGQRAVPETGRSLWTGQHPPVRAGRLPDRGSRQLPLAQRGPQVPSRTAQSDRREVLRVVERTGPAGRRPGHRSVLEPRGERDHLAGLRLVARGNRSHAATGGAAPMERRRVSFAVRTPGRPEAGGLPSPRVQQPVVEPRVAPRAASAPAGCKGARGQGTPARGQRTPVPDKA